MAVLAQQYHQPFCHDAGDTFAQSQIRQQFTAVAVACEAQQLFPKSMRLTFVGRELFQAFRANCLDEQFFAQAFGFGVGQCFEVVAYFGACAPSAYEPQPGGVRCGNRRGDDLDHIPIFQLSAQGHLLVVDFGGSGSIAHIAVDGVREIHHRGSARQCHDLALGCENIDRVRE